MQIEMEIPLKIVSESNCTQDWRKKATRHKKQKMAIFYSLKNSIPNDSLPCTVTMTRIAPRSFDFDNLIGSFKYIRDAISELLIPGTKAGRADSDPRITWVYQQAKGKPKTYSIKVKIHDGE